MKIIARILVCAFIALFALLYMRNTKKEGLADEKSVVQIMNDHGYTSVKIISKKPVSVVLNEELAVGTEYDVVASNGDVTISIQVFYRQIDKKVMFFQNNQRIEIE